MSDQELGSVARQLASLGARQPEIAGRGARLVERIATERFHIAVLGEFKRGKSTLVNALVGERILPSGVLPLTAVPTEIHFGSSEIMVTFLDGRRVAITPGEIATYVTEGSNPSNTRSVARVEVGVPDILGAPGVVLVDTPGVASIHEHNTASAHDALLDADAAILVLSADSPLSSSEEGIVAELARRRATVFVVINKADHLSEPDMNEVREFITRHLRRVLGCSVVPYCLSAKTALERIAAGSDAGSSFEAFREALERFVRADLAAARRASVVGELDRLTRILDNSVRIEEAGAAMSADQLSARIERLTVAAGKGQQDLRDDGVLLQHEVQALAQAAAQRLAVKASEVARTSGPALVDIAEHLSSRRLDDGLRDAIEDCVRQRFEPVRMAIMDELDRSWSALAEGFVERVQGRVDNLVAVANELFELHLPAVQIPPVAEQSDQFSYLFVRVEGPNAVIGRIVVSLLPSSLLRRHAVHQAERRLAESLDKHVGRARYDLTQRLVSARERFFEAMGAEYDVTRSSILDAAQRARSQLETSEIEREASGSERAQVRALVDRVETIVAGSAEEVCS